MYKTGECVARYDSYDYDLTFLFTNTKMPAFLGLRVRTCTTKHHIYRESTLLMILLLVS